jgi:acetolactate synthase-1/2/3 large subunit
VARRAGELLWTTLRSLGAEFAFGLPGSQTIDGFQALKHSGLRTIVPTHEMAAAFMANGYARVSGKPGIITTIPGPGFTYALTGLAEASLDSVPIVHVVPASREIAGREFALQAIDQRAMAGPVVKRIVHVDSPGTIGVAAAEAYRVASAGEPGPVMLEVTESDFAAEAVSPLPIPPATTPVQVSSVLIAEIVFLIENASRVLLYLGAGAIGALDPVRRLAELTGAAIVTTTSARGILKEDSPQVIVRDPGMQDIAVLRDLTGAADLILAIGCKFSHNGAAGFRLDLPRDRLVTVNPAGPSKSYPARIHVSEDAGRVLDALLPRLKSRRESGWNEAELAAWRAAALRFEQDARVEPRHEVTGAPASEIVRGLRAALADDAIVVTDSGYHQMSVRRHYAVQSPRGLIVPTNFQSMGFALPAAIGAALAAPSREVIAVVGDGGMLMSGLELITAVRERVRLTVIVFNDGAYSLIRNPQLAGYGESHGTELLDPDFEALAAAAGADYRLAGTDGIGPALERGNPDERAVRLVEVPLTDSPGLKRIRRRGSLRAIARRMVPARGRAWISRWLRS